LLDLSEQAQKDPDRVAVISASQGLTYGALHQRSQALLSTPTFHHLASESGGKVFPNANRRVIAFEAHGDLETFILAHALLDGRFIALPLNPRLTVRERSRLIDMAGAVLAERDELGWFVAQTTSGVSRSTTPTTAASNGEPFARRDNPATATSIPTSTASAPSAATSRPTILIATSGSTADPKLVQLSRQSLVASAEANAAHLQLTKEDRWLLSLSLSHIGGYSILTRCLHRGATVVLCESRPNIDALTNLVEQHEVTLLSVVPTMLVRLIAHASLQRLKSLRVILVGGAACPPQLLRKSRELGLPTLATYGMSETSSQIATQPLPDRYRTDEQPDCGFTLGRSEVRVVDEVIEVRGPTLFDGYVSKTSPLDLQRGTDDEGWFRTGDLGRVTPEGCVTVLGRGSDRIVTGGENVSSVEVEAELLSQPGIVEVAVLGIPDKEWGQLVAAAIVPSGEFAQLGSEWFRELSQALRQNLAAYKCPKSWLCLPELPRLSTGKLDRRRIAELFAPR